MDILLTINGAERRFSPPITVRGLVGEMGIEGKRIAIERNGAIVPRSRYDETALADGDRLEVVVAVGGG
jgi:sulfur carrier protein